MSYKRSKNRNPLVLDKPMRKKVLKSGKTATKIIRKLI